MDLVPVDEAGRLRLLLSRGLDLCVRARQLDQMAEEALERQDRFRLTRSATIPLWMEDQYMRDLAAWEADARSALTPGDPR